MSSFRPWQPVGKSTSQRKVLNIVPYNGPSVCLNLYTWAAMATDRNQIGWVYLVLRCAVSLYVLPFSPNDDPACAKATRGSLVSLRNSGQWATTGGFLGYLGTRVGWVIPREEEKVEWHLGQDRRTLAALGLPTFACNGAKHANTPL
jgi:hypothetical protein